MAHGACVFLRTHAQTTGLGSFGVFESTPSAARADTEVARNIQQRKKPRPSFREKKIFREKRSCSVRKKSVFGQALPHANQCTLTVLLIPTVFSLVASARGRGRDAGCPALSASSLRPRRQPLLRAGCCPMRGEQARCVRNRSAVAKTIDAFRIISENDSNAE